MANTVRITLPPAHAAALLTDTGAYGADAVIRTQAAATETGTFADLTGTGSDPTVPLVAGTETYFPKDPLGSSSTWYRARFESADGTRLSDWSAAKPTTYP
jgi:hypothetical protein